MPLRYLIVLLLVLALPASVRGQAVADHPRVAEAIHLLDVWLDAQLAYERIPGFSVAVVHDQELAWSRGYGYANLEQQVPATPETIYSICSISKLFTSIGVMQLRDEGHFHLDAPVVEILPWFNIRQLQAEGGPVTVRGLLTHSSGLPRETDHPYWSGPDFPFPTADEIRGRLGEQETLYPAFVTTQYSNLGLTLVGDIITELSGQSYEDYVRERLLGPLGLVDTTPDLPEALHGTRLAIGYSPLGREGVRRALPLFQARGIAPAAGFGSTVEDLARFASWQFRLLGGEEELLRPTTLREMHRVHWVDPVTQGTWGLGFDVMRYGGESFVGHGGSCPGYRSQLLIHPRDRIATVFMANAMGVQTRVYVERLHQIMAQAIKAAQNGEDASATLDPTLAPYPGRYESLWGDVVVLPWKGALHLLYLPTQDPLGSLQELRHVAGHVFRYVRPDGELGETIRFEVGDDGHVARMWRHSNYFERIDGTS